ncbi:unnamed protein product [Mytilus coruscus]|uniref:Reverse transcriptase/retrotransposon-derived protein RNase H-like domain-containing protein n=1 Tax=Mytilus coruscus TaxID=42192 RepID=A0A6J8EC25_MYTCO|nr:unnamed protein product [Mytilus coruscus]
MTYFCGGNTPEELLHNWECVLQSLQKSGICLSPSKTVICRKSITILGWIWSQGSISASTHRVATLASCPVPDTVRGLRSFIGAYKMLCRVIPNCSNLIAPLEETISGMKSADKIIWSDVLREHFEFAKKSLSSRKAITLPKCSDQLWIVTDGSVTKRVSLAGFFNAKLRKHQVLWLPCEIEALSIAASVKHFSPFIIQSKLQANVLKDSKPCVQGFKKLCRGEFSASLRVTSFLSVASRYQVSVNNLSGRANIPSDFASRNAPLCTKPNCQLNISIEIGRVKNQNKNPVADKAIAELEDELLREERDQSPLSENTLVIATTRLNSRLRQRGFSSRELWTQRNQFTHEQLPISDMNLIRAQHEARNKNHGFSEISKCSRPSRPIPDVSIGDLVYLYTDRAKTQSGYRYLAVARDGE